MIPLKKAFGVGKVNHDSAGKLAVKDPKKFGDLRIISVFANLV